MQWRQTLENFAFPIIGDLPVASIETAHVIRILDPIWRTKNETASRLRGRIERFSTGRECGAFVKARIQRAGKAISKANCLVHRKFRKRGTIRPCHTSRFQRS